MDEFENGENDDRLKLRKHTFFHFYGYITCLKKITEKQKLFDTTGVAKIIDSPLCTHKKFIPYF